MELSPGMCVALTLTAFVIGVLVGLIAATPVARRMVRRGEW